MSIILDNSTNTLKLGTDTSLTRKSANALSTPGSLDAAGLNITGGGNGITFPDSSVQLTAVSAYTLPTASSSVLGGVKVDGTTVTISSGIISATAYTLPTASASVLGGVKVDGTTITITGGVISSVGGSSGTVTDYNNTSRYQMLTTSGQEAWCVSSATVFANLSWSRSGTTLTVTHNSHGRSVGDRVNLRNTNVDNQSLIVSNPTTNTYDVTVANTGGTSGAAGAYSCGFTFAQNAGAGSITSGTLTAPAGADVQLLSLRIHLGASTRSLLTYNVVVPASVTNGAGGDTSNADLWIPQIQVRQDAASLSAVGATLASQVSGSWNTFQFAALSSTSIGLFFTMNF
jgi:hypothetical protein